MAASKAKDHDSSAAARLFSRGNRRRRGGCRRPHADPRVLPAAVGSERAVRRAGNLQHAHHLRVPALRDGRRRTGAQRSCMASWLRLPNDGGDATEPRGG